MKPNNVNTNSHYENEVDLRKLFISLVAKKIFIVVFTAILTLFGILYTFTLTPIYSAASSFKSTNDQSLYAINELQFLNETKESLQEKFIDLLLSPKLQLEVFDEGSFLTGLSPEVIENINSGFTGSISVTAPIIRTDAKFRVGELLEPNYIVTIEGENSDVISKYLLALVSTAKIETIDQLNFLNNLQAEIQINSISSKVKFLTAKEKSRRLVKIAKIKETVNENIRQIENQIERARFSAEQKRLNEIVILTEAAKLAGSLGIIENNFITITPTETTNISFNFSLSDEDDFPDWYVYGQKALNQRIQLIENRASEEPFIEGLVNLKVQLDEAKNNNVLKTLENRQDDSLFINEIVDLNIQRQIIAENMGAIMPNTDVVQVLRNAELTTIIANKINIVFLTLIFSFFVSILFALIMIILKPDEKASS